jgi:DNA polymerase-3 subunit delta
MRKKTMAPKKTTGADAGLQQLKKDISSDAVGTCYLFYGEEDYLRDYYVTTIRKKLIPQGMEDFNLHVFQGKELDVHELGEAVDAFPMMCERSLILVYDFDLYQNESRRDALQEILSDLPEYVCLIFIFDQLDFKTGGNTKLGKLVKKVATAVNFQPQTQSDLNGWIRRRFRALGKEIDNSTAEYLTFLCGGLMTGLQSEIDKIASYAAGVTVEKSDVDAVADPVLDAKVFQMTDAISNGNFRQSAEILSDLYLMNTEPIMILAVLGRQMRQLWSARLALENRMGQQELAEIWDMKSSWQARKLLDSARHFNLRWCRRAVELCAETDLAMKSSGLDNEELLTELLLRLANGG